MPNPDVGGNVIYMTDMKTAELFGVSKPGVYTQSMEDGRFVPLPLSMGYRRLLSGIVTFGSRDIEFGFAALRMSVIGLAIIVVSSVCVVGLLISGGLGVVCAISGKRKGSIQEVKT